MKQIFKISLISMMLVGLSGCMKNVRAESEFEALTIKTAGGKEVTYQIEIADTDASRRKGLMYRQELPTNRGMLLDFKRPEQVAIWMKNTYLSLDVIFIDVNGIITRIVPRAVPHSTELMRSDTLVRAVLELNAGQAAYHGISSGDRVLHRVFADALDGTD